MFYIYTQAIILNSWEKRRFSGYRHVRSEEVGSPMNGFIVATIGLLLVVGQQVLASSSLTWQSVSHSKILPQPEFQLLANQYTNKKSTYHLGRVFVLIPENTNGMRMKMVA